MKEEYLICPVCGKGFKTLFQHLKMKHNYTNEQINKEFKEKGKPLQIDCRKKEILICEYCGRKFKTQNALGIHIKSYHPEYFKKKERIRNEETAIKCLICGQKIYGNIVQHLKIKHDISFEEYSEKYDYNGPKCLFSDKHKESLSENKQIFYNETERGKELREEQSKKYSGKLNPIHLPGVKEKISTSAIKRLIRNKNEEFFNYSYGIIVKFEFNGIWYRTRSFEEFKILYTLLENGITFKYEKIVINYTKNNKKKKYLLDLKVNEDYIEIKTNPEKYKDDEKYLLINKELNNINKTLMIMNKTMICELYNLENKSHKYFIQICKDLLKENKCKLQQTMINRKVKPRIFLSIDSDYLNNPNIKLSIKSKKEK